MRLTGSLRYWDKRSPDSDTAVEYWDKRSPESDTAVEYWDKRSPDSDTAVEYWQVSPFSDNKTSPRLTPFPATPLFPRLFRRRTSLTGPYRDKKAKRDSDTAVEYW
jgi:hypothetical protein